MFDVYTFEMQECVCYCSVTQPKPADRVIDKYFSDSERKGGSGEENE